MISTPVANTFAGTLQALFKEAYPKHLVKEAMSTQTKKRNRFDKLKNILKEKK